MSKIERIFGIENYIYDFDTAVTIGKFDGIHRGHHLLTADIAAKELEGLKSLVITFDETPRKKLMDQNAKTLVTNEERANILEKEGISIVVECPFTEELMKMDAKDFIKLLCDKVHMKYLIVGNDFRFGYMGKGDSKLLEELSKEFNFELKVIDKMKEKDRDISSTYIREEIQKGNLEHVHSLLDYPYFIWGEIVHGKHIGHKLGIPTINLIPPSDKLLPPNGVYVTEVEIDGITYHGVTNIGVKPTIEGKRAIGVETHIFDFNQNVYGNYARIEFLAMRRPEIKFDSLEELKAQLLLDCKDGRDYFNKKS